LLVPLLLLLLLLPQRLCSHQTAQIQCYQHCSLLASQLHLMLLLVLRLSSAVRTKTVTAAA
jgi:hypothetical protein